MHFASSRWLRLLLVVGGLSLALAAALRGPPWLWDVSIASFVAGLVLSFTRFGRAERRRKPL
jgi:hypothetical protein